MKLPDSINVGTSQTVIDQIKAIIEEHDLSIIEATIMFAESSGMDIEFLGDVIKTDGLLKALAEEEAEKLHFIKPIARLDI